ncbi:hypothetical protein A4H97_26200 [Niastella yeongjuensis]|uniref:DUF4403 domain-containing protein n=1 Tax=Niastella yeongjuensis TaxID=354355 RepID=A0A1V9F1B0_9BACT|nr:DUF4403 family protein [Niastella yeongjuensis]OQP52107.1 hypothetical protein A4H97_26200 [Niastella yeongjuensis]SEP37488.1 protein of unknown function [Niastella yeongjuensis]
MKHTLGFLALLICISACNSSKKVTIQPTAETAARLLPAMPSSIINIPFKIYMKPLLTMMDSGTAKEFTNDKWPNYTQSGCDFRYKFRFVRSPFTFGCVNNKVTIGFRGSYQIAGSKAVCAMDKQVSPWVSGSCGFGNEPLRRVDLNISSTLTLLPNHQVLTSTKPDKISALDKCEVTMMHNDLTNEIMDSIKASVENTCGTFDKFVQTLNNNEMLRQWRSGGSRVIPISTYGFLNLNPSGLRVSNFNLYRDTLYFSIGYSGDPKFSSDSQRLVTHAALPPINNSPYSTGINTYLDAVYQYSFFNKLMTDSLVNKPFEVEGRTFVIKDVNLSGTNDGKIQVDVSFSGNRKGVLHLKGTPVLDAEKQVLSMPDVSFALDTKDMMVNIAKALFRKKIMKQLANQSVLDIAALIDKNKKVIEARLNQQITPWMSSAGTFQEFRLMGLLPQKDYIQVQAYIRGTLMFIGQPPTSMLKK